MQILISHLSCIFSDTTIKGPKRPPSSVQIFGVDSTTVRVKWNQVVVSEGDESIKGYKIRIWDESGDQSPVKEVIISDAAQSETIVDQLKPDILYKMRMLAYSESGNGRSRAPVIRFQTSTN